MRARSVIAEERWIMGEEACPPSVIPMLTTLDEHNFYQAQIGSCSSSLETYCDYRKLKVAKIKVRRSVFGIHY